MRTIHHGEWVRLTKCPLSAATVFVVLSSQLRVFLLCTPVLILLRLISDPLPFEIFHHPSP